MAAEPTRIDPYLEPKCMECRLVADYQHAIALHERTESRLREALARETALLCQKEELLRQRELLSQEADHRLMNGLQMIVSLLSLQSRAETNVEAAAHLAIAANRVATISRVHKRLHSLDGTQAIPFKRYLEDLCGEYGLVLSSEHRLDKGIVVAGIEIMVPTLTAIPLSLIANELITNAIKHGKGLIRVTLKTCPTKGFALSVFNDGSALPEGFDPTACKGLGMRIISALVGQIGGELRIDRGDNNDGTRFTVLFHPIGLATAPQ